MTPYELVIIYEQVLLQLRLANNYSGDRDTSYAIKCEIQQLNEDHDFWWRQFNNYLPTMHRKLCCPQQRSNNHET